MGSTASTILPVAPEAPKRTATTPRTTNAPPTAVISERGIAFFEQAFVEDTQAALAQTVLSKTDFAAALASRHPIRDQQIFNVTLSSEGNPVTNQKISGRCWLFATTNVLRIPFARKLKLDEFQFSQSYLFFWDSFEKANFFLENMIDLADSKLDDRVIQHLMKDPEGDGGQWSMASNLVEKYGLVPQAVFPESFNSSATRQLDGLLTSKLREYALELRKEYRAALKSVQSTSPHQSPAQQKSSAQQSVRRRKQEQLEEIYRILSITLGTPPRANEPFTWEYYTNADKKSGAIRQYKKLTMTPLEFYRHADYSLPNSISLIHDPRNAYNTAYEVERLGNVVGGSAVPVRYVNANIDVLKATAIKLLQADRPVWFGCDVGKNSSSSLGIMDQRLFATELAFGTTMGLSKAERLETGDSAMTHAMTITAVHLEEGKSVRWRVENSWGPEACDKGYMIMSDEWFDENVFQVVAPRQVIPADLVKVFDDSQAVVLPPWDPLGSLA